MVNIVAASVAVGATTYNMAKSGYPESPTVMSGVEVTWGAPSCLEHDNGTQTRLSLWLPKSHESEMPALGDVVTITATAAGTTAAIFYGKVDSVLAQDNHLDSTAGGGYRINITAGDALTELAKYRLSDSPWPYQQVTQRYERLRELFPASLPLGELDSEFALMYDQSAAPKDVDSYNALEAIQKVSMVMGTTPYYNGEASEIKLRSSLKLPSALLADQTNADVQYSWEGFQGQSRSLKKTSDGQTFINWARYGSYPYSPDFGIGANYGPGGAGFVALYFGNWPSAARRGSTYTNMTWTTAPTGGPRGWTYSENIAGTGTTTMSAGFWVRFKNSLTTPTIRAAITYFNAGTAVGSKESTTYTLKMDNWTYITVDGAQYTGDFDKIVLEARVQSAINANLQLESDGVFLAESATAGEYFDGDSLDPSANILIDELTVNGQPIVEIPASAIVDDAFLLDHVNTVNQVKVAYSLTTDSQATFNDATLTLNDPASINKVPQQRTLESDLAWDGTGAKQVSGVLVIKASQVLAAQSQDKWRLASTVNIVLSALADQPGISQLLSMDTRQGLIVKITGVPKINQFQRIRGGRILLGAEPSLELDVEPVDYSVPTPLTRNSLLTDTTAVDYLIANFHDITSNDLRSIGPR